MEDRWRAGAGAMMMRHTTEALVMLACVVAGAAGDQLETSKPDAVRKNNLGTLSTRCRALLDLQTALHDGIKDLNTAIEANADRKPGTEEEKTAVKLAKRQKAVIVETMKVHHVVKSEGSAAALVEVLEQTLGEMKSVQDRLERCEAGKATRDISGNIVETLEEMNAALTKG